MRPAVLAGLVLATLPAAAAAQNAPYLAVVADPEVVVRAGPSDKFPETGAMKRGAKLVVDHEEPNGWLAVEAPQGQVSWVQVQFVEGFDPKQPTPQLVFVSLGADEGEITMNPGRGTAAEPLPDVRRVKVPNGTILTAVGPKAAFGGKSWYPVTPPPGDFRYLPKTAVQFDKLATTTYVVRETAPPGLPPGPLPASGTTIAPISTAAPPAAGPDAGKPAVNHPLWAQAETAEREGRLDDAEKLFFQLARVMNEPGGDADTANLCYSRIHLLREKKQGGSSPGPRVQPATRPEPMRDGRPTLLPPVARDDRPATPAAPPAVTGRAEWTNTGWLRSSPLAPDGKQAFAFETAGGVVSLYAMAEPGVDLKALVNHKVELFGVTGERRDLSKPFIRVQTVRDLGK